MEFLSPAWWSALMAIILIDLVLAGDNAIVIALAARNLPKHLQRKAIIWGTVGAIGVRTVMTLIVVWLLKIPGLMLVGGLGLLWIAYKLIADQGGGEDEHGPAASTFWGAMKTIVIADALMGIDNVLGVAGAAHGAMDLVVIGLLISVPIVVFGSTMVLKLVDRFPIIIYLGAAVLAGTVYAEHKPPYGRALALPAIARVLGFDAEARRLQAAAFAAPAGRILRLPFADIRTALRGHCPSRRFSLRSGRIEPQAVPYAAFAAQMAAQWDYGYRQAQQMLEQAA